MQLNDPIGLPRFLFGNTNSGSSSVCKSSIVIISIIGSGITSIIGSGITSGSVAGSGITAVTTGILTICFLGLPLPLLVICDSLFGGFSNVAEIFTRELYELGQTSNKKT